MKRENVLFISLGRSPAVVPETMDALLDNNIKINRIYLITTSDETIMNECIPLIEKDFEIHYKPKNIELVSYDCVLASDDIYDETDNLELMLKVAGILKREKRNNIYLSMAGGRKTMSAAMALLAQIYNARAITHVLVPSEIERMGNIRQLKQLSETEQQKILHPKEKRLIFFPVIGISWMLDDIIKALYGKELSPTRHEISDILKDNGLLDQEYKPTKLGEYLLKLLNDIEKIPEPHFEEVQLRFKEKESPHAPKNFQKFVSQLKKKYRSYLKEIVGIKFINSSETKINQIYNNNTIRCQFSDGSKAYVLDLVTTAKTSGEIETLKKMLTPFFKPHLKQIKT
ncbi:MAG: CRISPR-associated ring nuclease [Candidatus Helarchaeota archaeon]